jgi:hypothetical protein
MTPAPTGQEQGQEGSQEQQRPMSEVLRQNPALTNPDDPAAGGGEDLSLDRFDKAEEVRKKEERANEVPWGTRLAVEQEADRKAQEVANQAYQKAKQEGVWPQRPVEKAPGAEAQAAPSPSEPSAPAEGPGPYAPHNTVDIISHPDEANLN